MLNAGSWALSPEIWPQQAWGGARNLHFDPAAHDGSDAMAGAHTRSPSDYLSGRDSLGLSPNSSPTSSLNS